MIGKLYLIPTTLGDTEPLEVMPLSVKKVLKKLIIILLKMKNQQEGLLKKLHQKNRNLPYS